MPNPRNVSSLAMEMKNLDFGSRMIRSRNVIFNKKVLYKDISSVETDMADSDTSP